MAGGGGAAMYMAALVVVVVLAALTVVQGQDGEAMGKCLLDCSEKVVLCTGECGLDGGKAECYEKCATTTSNV